MWYEIFPSLFIVTTLIMLPQFTCFRLNQLVFGKPSQRAMDELWDRRMLLRDLAITNDTMVGGGLENIPDEAETKKK